MDVNLHNYINKKIDGVTINIEAECIAIERSWTPPVYPKCLNQKGENVYAVGGGINCNTQYKCNNFEVCRTAGSCADNPATTDIDESCTDTPRWRQLTVPVGDTHVPGICRMPGEALDSIVDVTDRYDTEEKCLSNMTWVPPMNRVKKYYEISQTETKTITKPDNTTETELVFKENDNRQCVAGDFVKEKYGYDECPKNDPYCNQFPKINRIDIDSDNYNHMMLSASFTKFGKLQRCDSRGAYNNQKQKYDNQLHPLAPCPTRFLTTVTFLKMLCLERDLKRQLLPLLMSTIPVMLLLFEMQNVTTAYVLNTTCGAGLYDNETRNGMVCLTVFVPMKMVTICLLSNGL